MENIALITDIHANLEALEAVLEDIQNNQIKTIYCLGDAIGLGPNPKECLDLLMHYKIVNILGNGDEYSLLGTEPFTYLVKDTKRYENAVWTRKQLTNKHIAYLSEMPHSIDLEIAGKKIALCHFPVDVRYDFSGVWNYHGEDVRQFFETNTSEDLRIKKPLPNKGYQSALQEPLWNGKEITQYDIIIYGHYHFFRYHKKSGIEFYSLASTGVNQTSKAIYYILKDNNGKIELEEKRLEYDFEKLCNKLDAMDYPNKELFEKRCNKIGSEK